MTDLDRLTTENSVLKQELEAACTHIHCLNIAAVHACEDRDYLRQELDRHHTHMIQIVTEFENEVEVLEASNATLQSDLRTSLDEQIRLLSHRRQLSLHLRGLMVLVRPGTFKATPSTATHPSPVVIEHPTETMELAPTILERIVSWFRKTRIAQAA